jgi:hypothetical protein
MKLHHCAAKALRKIEVHMPDLNLTEEESHKLKSLGAFLLLAAIAVFFNQLGRWQ